MHFSIISTITAALLLHQTTASPLHHPQQPHLTHRAGAPIPRPIPSNCSITSPFATHITTTRYRPTPAANTTILYSYFLQPDSAASSNASTLFANCLQTCYGYGNVGDCKSAYLAYDYPMPPEFGLAGGNPVVACLMWAGKEGAGDFEVVPANVTGYGNSTVGDINCPA